MKFQATWTTREVRTVVFEADSITEANSIFANDNNRARMAIVDVRHELDLVRLDAPAMAFNLETVKPAE